MERYAVSEIATTDTQDHTPSWKDKTLKLAGYGYSVGDLSMAAAAKLRSGGDANVFSGALIWLAGGIAAAVYGNPDPRTQLQLLSHRFEAHLQQQGITIPQDVRAQHALLNKPGFLGQCQEFLYKHPSEMLNAAYGIGAALLLKDGFRELAAGDKKLIPVFKEGLKRESVLGAVNGMSKNFWMGALIGGGALSGLLIKEDADARKKAEHGNMLDKAVAYVQEKPLRVTGTLYGLNNVFAVLKAVEDYSHRGLTKGVMKPYHFSGLTAGSYILSNILLTTVSRDHATAKKLDSSALTPLQDAAARVIAAQPQEKREALIADMAEYLGNQKEVGMSKEQLVASLNAQLAKLPEMPLHTKPVSWAGRVTARTNQHADIQV
jgi:hypothetical protein